MSNFFDDPFNNESSAENARKFFQMDPKQSPKESAKLIYNTAGQNESLVTGNDEADAEAAADAGEAKDSVPMGAKQEWLAGLMRGLPSAIAVAISKDPGKALISVMQSRQDYEVEQERRQEREGKEKTRVQEKKESTELEKRRIDEAERAAQAQESFNQIMLKDKLALERELEEGRMERAHDTIEIRKLETSNRMAIALASDANSMSIAKINTANNLAMTKFQSTLRANTQLEIQRMRDSGEIEKWRRDGALTLTMAGEGDPLAAQNGRSIMAKIEKSGQDALTPEEMQLVERARNLKPQTNDETRKQLLLVAKKATEEGMKTQYVVDAKGDRVPVAGKQGAELVAFVRDGVQAYMASVGVEGAFHLPGGDPTQDKATMQGEWVENFKGVINNGLEPAEAYKIGLSAVENGFMTKEQFDSLGLVDPNAQREAVRGENMDTLNKSMQSGQAFGQP